jgi:hypothetical protein
LIVAPIGRPHSSRHKRRLEKRPGGAPLQFKRPGWGEDHAIFCSVLNYAPALWNYSWETPPYNNTATGSIINTATGSIVLEIWPQIAISDRLSCRDRWAASVGSADCIFFARERGAVDDVRKLRARDFHGFRHGPSPPIAARGSLGNEA